MEEEMALAEEQLRARRLEQEKRSPLGSVRWVMVPQGLAGRSGVCFPAPPSHSAESREKDSNVSRGHHLCFDALRQWFLTDTSHV